MINDPIAKSSANNNVGILLFPTTGVYAFSSIIRGVILCKNILNGMGYDYSIVLHHSSFSLVQSLPHSSILYRIAFHHTFFFLHFTAFLLTPLFNILYHGTSLSKEFIAVSKTVKGIIYIPFCL